MNEIARDRLLQEVETRLAEAPITVLLGARQTGKTTLAHMAWNAAELARSLGATEKTARRYLDILAGAYMTRVLPA